jgi:hypothetical protein
MRWAVILLLLTGTAMARPDPKALARELMREPPSSDAYRFNDAPQMSPRRTPAPADLLRDFYQGQHSIGERPSVPIPDSEIDDPYLHGMDDFMNKQLPKPKPRGSRK